MKDLMTCYVRLQNLLDDLLDPDTKLGAILGAGISVEAGVPAFRSDNSIFMKLQHDYETWPERDNSADSFLSYAFSVMALLNDPRVLYRVLYHFELDIKETVIYPTDMHFFLQYLALCGKLTKVVTQNIDNLEIQVGLQTLLGDRLVQAHGSNESPPMCINSDCPGNILTRTLLSQKADQTQIMDILSKLYCEIQQCGDLSGKVRVVQRNIPILALQPSSVHFSVETFRAAVRDCCVPCCMFCGCALKPGMTLYGEMINLSQDIENYIFQDVDSLLVIGTSLNVAPVSHLPAKTAAQASIHLITKHFDLDHYLFQQVGKQGECVHQAILQSKMEIIAYDEGENALAKLIQRRSLNLDNDINRLTPLFSYHKGSCSELLDRIFQHIPELKQEIEKLKQNHYENSNTLSDPVINGAEAENNIDNQEIKTAEIYLAIPALWPPDAMIYQVERQNCEYYAILCTVTPQQLDLLYKFCQEVKVIGNEQEVPIYVQSEYETLYPFDDVVYLPILSHWSVYMQSYNAYTLINDQYVQKFDPWSFYFVGYQEKQIYRQKQEKQFVYQGVFRNFATAHSNYSAVLKYYTKRTSSVFSSEFYQIVMDSFVII